MNDLLSPAQPPVPPSESGESLTLADYAQRAYLEYALSVVKGRALPAVADGQKPVQRRILYAMSRMGLAFSGTTGAKPVKSARVVGDVLGRFHPHGDQAAYDALVRMAQNFHQRYPLIDGQGNFGSRDGDGAAAMRYTEARLSRITRLLLDEIDEGTVDFVPNYDGSTNEPALLPGRLPFVLLNGASGIAVGLATEIPSHNLAEVAAACVALIRDPALPDSAVAALLPGPDYPGGAQIISSDADIAEAYRTGRGSLKVRARWVIEELARGQWQMVVNELPPGVSSQKVLEEVEEITNPKIKTGKKSLSLEQTQLKASLLAVLDAVRDESSKDAPVRLVFEPKSSRISAAELSTALLAYTSLETSSPINLTMVGIDGRPTQKSLRQMLLEWIAFRQTTVQRRSTFRLQKVLDRIHILEGRQLVLLNIDEVIALIREADEPKPALMARFRLSDRQAEDILEIRLRQLARLEAIRIQQELAELRTQQQDLEQLLSNPQALRRLLIKEIETDARQFADPRRTLIQADRKATLETRVIDEPVTVIVSGNGWVRTQKGWAGERATPPASAPDYAVKAGDSLYGAFECRTVDVLLVFGSNGRVYSVPVASLPGGRGDGLPLTSLVELESGTRMVHFYAGAVTTQLLVASSGAYGFLASVGDMVSRQKGGKAYVSCNEGESLCRPSVMHGDRWTVPATHVACVSTLGRILCFELARLKPLPNGGRGLMLLDLEGADRLAGAVGYARSVHISGLGRGGKAREETLEIRSLNNAVGVRGRKGKAGDFGFKPSDVQRLE